MSALSLTSSPKRRSPHAAEDRRAPSPQLQEELIRRGAHRHGHQATAQGGGPQQRGHMGSGGGGRLRSPGRHRPRYAGGPGCWTLSSWVSPGSSSARFNDLQHVHPKDLIHTRIPWWTTWVASVRRLVSEEAFQDMDYLLPTVSKDFAGLIRDLPHWKGL